jgi:hypothetical protein
MQFLPDNGFDAIGTYEDIALFFVAIGQTGHNSLGVLLEAHTLRAQPQHFLAESVDQRAVEFRPADSHRRRTETGADRIDSQVSQRLTLPGEIPMRGHLDPDSGDSFGHVDRLQGTQRVAPQMNSGAEREVLDRLRPLQDHRLHAGVL